MDTPTITYDKVDSTEPRVIFNNQIEHPRTFITVVDQEWNAPDDEPELLARIEVERLKIVNSTNPHDFDGTVLNILDLKVHNDIIEVIAQRCKYSEYKACIALNRKDLMNVGVVSCDVITKDGYHVFGLKGSEHKTLAVIGGMLSIGEIENLQRENSSEAAVLKAFHRDFRPVTSTTFTAHQEIFEELGAAPQTVAEQNLLAVVEDNLPRIVFYYRFFLNLTFEELKDLHRHEGALDEIPEIIGFTEEELREYGLPQDVKLPPAARIFLKLFINQDSRTAA